MKLHSPNADLFVPDGAPLPEALQRITHLGIGAHQDDLEFMAFHGTVQCFQHEHQRWFGGVICTDGGGSARTGAYSHCSDEEMRRIRRDEQRAAAVVGRYSAMIQLGFPSSALKSPENPLPTHDLLEILSATRPEVIYTHNLADKHETHVAVVSAVIQAIRQLPAEQRPRQLLGCEVWRSLDWLGDSEKVILDVSGHDHLAAALNGIFDSQIAGGKRYDLATTGRRAANATFLESHATDKSTQVTFAMDLTPLIRDPFPDPADFILSAVDRFRGDVAAALRRYFRA